MSVYKTRATKHTAKGLTGLFLLGLFLPTSVHALTLARDLKLGDTGDDVHSLQVALNTNTTTRVADSGPGSPGQETDYFGEKTLSAVIAYQNLHASEVLAPLGLARGTGYVGSATRASLAGTVVKPVSANSSTNPTFDQALKAFDATLTGGGGTNMITRVPVEDPAIPSTQDELVAALKDFAGEDVTAVEAKEFSANMVLKRYGYGAQALREQQPDDDDDDTGGGGGDDDDDTGGGGGNGGGSRRDADTDTTGAGCIRLLLDLLGL